MAIIQAFFRPEDRADIKPLTAELQERVNEIVVEFGHQPLDESGQPRFKVETGRNPFCGVWSVEGDADTAELVAERMGGFKRKVKPSEVDALLVPTRSRGVAKQV
jgi:hypothetical protein